MTEPDRPADAPSGNPTPEEISARLEALLKRTHAMRTEQAARPASAGVTWPPTQGELAHYDVVDVVAPPHETPASTQAAAEGPATDPQPRPSTTDFARPDWGELRLRQDADEGRRSWLPFVAGLLALVVIGQSAYIWLSLAPATAGTDVGHLRISGPSGAEVRLDGAPIGVAPLDRSLPPGTYDVMIGDRTASERVTIEASARVVLLPVVEVAEPPTAEQRPASATMAPPVQDVPPATPSPAAPAGPTATGPPVAGVSATRGAVLIESTPPGLPVTMEGRERGVTPIRIGQLRPGRHDVLVGGLARKVDVTANEVATLRVDTP